MTKDEYCKKLWDELWEMPFTKEQMKDIMEVYIRAFTRIKL